jgi:diaminopropionate ammonia-lyase
MISIIENKNASTIPNKLISRFDLTATEKVHSFHQTFPNYKPTPLVELKGLAAHLGVNKIWLKDESYRFGLNAFKVLGASYAVANILKEKFMPGNTELSFSIFTNESIRKKMKHVTLITATDGNHGRGVAWTAQRLVCKCVVYMPKGTTTNRYQNIKSLGADVHIIDGNYEEASQTARSLAEKNNWILVQDSSWDGYEEIPLFIMQGYLTIMKEFFDKIKNEKPTHVFVQCGVGSLPGAVAANLKYMFANDAPIFCVVEPESAACVYESFFAGDEKMHTTKSKANTIMAGLACETPSKLAWEILKDYSNYFITCDDSATTDGMKILHNQKFGDPKIISGESGAVTTGLAYQLLSNPLNKKLAEQLRLNSDSKIFLISTEGDTDPEMYKKILSGN